ncbi:MAG: FAD-dependent oxidoreductase [Armatimonadota bacterium]|nr:FAD-dependent oxidoreductase [Armatimonadota bacterium]MDR7474950.1 FAD-dependent oxidoreductase [Armatimonadota bacterium]
MRRVRTPARLLQGAMWLLPALLLAAVGRPVWAREEHLDILVVGGTPAGIAAAVAAARSGHSVALVEARPFLGGVLTGAMLSSFDLSRGPDGGDSVGGIFHEVYRELGLSFDPRTARVLLLELVRREPAIDLRLATRVRTVLVAEGRARGAVLDDGTKIQARVLIDATDDGDIATAAGARYTVGRESSGVDRLTQAATLMFRLRNVSWPDIVSYLRRYEKPRRTGGVYGSLAWGYRRIVTQWRSPHPERIAAYDLNLSRLPDGSVWVNALQIFGLDGTDPASRLDGYRRAKRIVPAFVAFLREQAPGFARAALVEVAPELYIRETRHVEGLYTLTARDVIRQRHFWDRIAAAAYALDLHPYHPGWINPYPPRRFYFTVPLRSLVVRDVDNLFVCSRAFSATYQAAGAARVVPVTMALGQAAGIAASVSIEAAVSAHALLRRHDLVALVQWRLQASGARISHPAQVPRAPVRILRPGGPWSGQHP